MWRLTGATGPYEGVTFDISSESVTTIGSTPGCDILLDRDDTVPALAVDLRWAERRLTFSVNHEAKTVYHNGNSVSGGELEPGDTLEIGDTVFRIEGERLLHAAPVVPTVDPVAHVDKGLRRRALTNLVIATLVLGVAGFAAFRFGADRMGWSFGEAMDVGGDQSLSNLEGAANAASRERSFGDLERIQRAKQVWASETGAPTYAEPTPDDLAPYIEGGFPEAPIGEYVIGTVAEPAASSVFGALD